MNGVWAMATKNCGWPRALRRYLLATLALPLIWEIVQLPLYTIWTTDPLPRQAFAVLHCTIGDAMIAGLSLLIALAVVGRANWPLEGITRVWMLTLALGICYTFYSEWLNVNVRGNWAYSDLMPKLPLGGIGVSPLLQWLVVPTIVLWFAIGRPPWIEPGIATSPNP